MSYTPSTIDVRMYYARAVAELGIDGDLAFNRWFAAEEQRIRADERAKIAARILLSRIAPSSRPVPEMVALQLSARNDGLNDAARIAALDD